MTKDPRQRLKDRRILVIEDEYFLADDLKRVLSSEGAHVIGPTGDRAEAIKLIDRDGFEIAVIDINLHDELAYPLADELERKGIPFVFATGYSRDVIPDRFARVLRWEKPYELRGIVDGLVGLCERSMRGVRRPIAE
ncbi:MULTISPECIES: response regulator [unclassified Bradyrhizobium]|uniref:response regulator n=1 Tax=unclassified Bradyrhizobium TaxID=2631580 RepID=UPI0015CD7CBE|nr:MULTISPECIES: response regulator [unclassified Bradyrhizobium]MBB4261428.1 CheY-like chemotaxis protein [Bradyrhizobium sp. CIR3A]NYG47678.1 CheY-like chemotaxis protein [Bradyrhizobium sp. IAR9]